jgi:CelD/BcsL family acetyltransferase involved in cellulose biosynthesis
MPLIALPFPPRVVSGRMRASRRRVALGVLGAAPPAEREWDALADATGAAPFARPGWFAAWWRSWGTGRLELLEVRRDGRLAGVAALMRARRTLASVANWHTPVYAVLAEDGEALQELAAAIFGRRQDRVVLSPLDADGAQAAELTAAARAAGYRCRHRIEISSPYLPIDGDWERYLAGRRTRFLSELERRRRRLSDVGAVAVRVVTGDPGLDAALDAGFAIEGSGWKDEQGTAIASSPDTAAFYRDVAHWAAGRGWLRLQFLDVDDRPVAFKYSLEAAGVQWYLKGGYDPEFRRYAPAQLLQLDVLRTCFADGLEGYEFLGEAEPFKLEWTAAIRDRVALQAFAPTASGRAEWAARTRVWPLVRQARALIRR